MSSCKKLLDFVGIPYVDAFADAEAECAILVKAGKAHAVATEDMDALTFGADLIIRHFSTSNDKNKPIQEYNLKSICEELKLNQEQFVDLCILLGCDFSDTIKGLGPNTALKLLRKHGSLENIVSKLNAKKFTVPENFNYSRIREIFLQPTASDASVSEHSFKWNKPDIDGLSGFLLSENNFNSERVKNCIERLKKTRSVSAQTTINAFFTSKRSVVSNNQDSIPRKVSKKEAQ